jgi:tRNA-dihydrouridine synthase
MTIYFAPFHGMTNRHFRRVFFSHFGGVDAVLSPFLPVGKSAVLSKARFADILPPHTDPAERIVQLLGTDTQAMYDTVGFLYDCGYKRMNWNLGCPMPQIVRKQRGCGLMPYPEKIADTVETVMQHTGVQFSIKMRLGMYKAEESVEIIKRLNDYPLDFIAIHARLGTQLYEGQTDKEAFGDCFQQSINRLCYEGDINTVNDFRQLQTLFPDLEGCMLGRGMLRNPFLAQHIQQGATLHEKERFSAFYADLLACYFGVYTKVGALNRLKGLWSYFAGYLSLSQQDLQRLLRITDPHEFLNDTTTIVSENAKS